MIALISFLLIVLMSVIAVKLGGIALQSTGLSRDIANFQAQSAFSGVGFTTRESENIVNNPVRRNILRLIMLMGSAGLTTAVATLVLALNTENQTRTYFGYTFYSNFMTDAALIVIAIVFFYFISSTRAFENVLKWILKNPLDRLKASVYLYDYEHLLALSKGYSIATIEVKKKSWMVRKSIKSLRIQNEGVLILGISRVVQKKEMFIGSPSLDFRILTGDKVTMYGQESSLIV